MNITTKQLTGIPLLADYYLDGAVLVVESWNYKEGCVLRQRVRRNDAGSGASEHKYFERQLIGINVIEHDERIQIKHVGRRGFASTWRAAQARLLIEEMTDFSKFAAYAAA